MKNGWMIMNDVTRRIFECKREEVSGRMETIIQLRTS